MTDQSLLFSAPMILALLAGRKTQTRRLAAPRWKPGDVVWVRENFTLVPATAYRMSEGAQQTVNPTDLHMAAIYAAGWDRSIPKWKPSIHMPRWASRLTLDITAVRQERLQDISEADAIAEGLYKSLPDDEDREWFANYTEEQSGEPPTQGEIDQFEEGVWMVPGVPQGWGLNRAERQRDTWSPTPRFAYQQIWEHINGAGSWAENPTVNVSEFAVHKANIDTIKSGKAAA